MASVYQKLGLFGRTYWKDDGLFVKQITKRQYEDFVLRSEVAKEVARQTKKSKKNQSSEQE